MTTSLPRFSTLRVPPELEARVLEGIRRARTRAYRLRLAVNASFFVLSAGGSYAMARATLSAAQASGFFTLAQLARTDTGIIAAHAHSFGLSLIETLPSADVALTLFALSVFLVATRGLVHALASLFAPESGVITNHIAA